MKIKGQKKEVLDPIRVRIRQARGHVKRITRPVRQSFLIRKIAVNTLSDLATATPQAPEPKEDKTDIGAKVQPQLATTNVQVKRPRGRPMGSKAKPKLRLLNPSKTPRTREESLHVLLDSCEHIITTCYAKLEENDWKNVKPTDLLAFMVLAKDLIKDLHSTDTTSTSTSALDEWTKGV